MSSSDGPRASSGDKDKPFFRAVLKKLMERVKYEWEHFEV
jgi:hypothetical protein